jgi:hypothetical protein
MFGLSVSQRPTVHRKSGAEALPGLNYKKATSHKIAISLAKVSTRVYDNILLQEIAFKGL